uniref:Uncharacterized protein MANES_02G117200 n=1 Tax=Rhizophora mucronata TaxID=61149 RepID=A0A2P2K4Z4_RHIMU
MNNVKEIDDKPPSPPLQAPNALNSVLASPPSVPMNHAELMPSEFKTSPPLTSTEKNITEPNSGQQPLQHSPPPAAFDDGKGLLNAEHEKPKPNKNESPDCVTVTDAATNPSEIPEIKPALHASPFPKVYNEPPTLHAESSNITAEPEDKKESRNGQNMSDLTTPENNGHPNSKIPFLLDDDHDGSDSGTEEEQSAFMKELETFFKEKRMEFKPPKFYGEGLNCIKLWRAVMRLGGYDKVTSCKLWRQVGESFKPPKTCTTVSWTFRGFYEKALLEYERHKTHRGELNIPIVSNDPLHGDNQASKVGRARRDAAERAMKGWHSQRHLDNDEDKNALSLQKHEKQFKSLGKQQNIRVDNFNW